MVYQDSYYQHCRSRTFNRSFLRMFRQPESDHLTLLTAYKFYINMKKAINRFPTEPSEEELLRIDQETNLVDLLAPTQITRDIRHNQIHIIIKV